MSVAVRTAYDTWAASYDGDPNRTRDLEAAALYRDPPRLGADRRVLELACGTGKNTGWLAARSARVLASDFSWAMLLRARRRLRDAAAAGRVRWALHDATRPWPFRAAAFDVVVVSLVLEHVADLVPVYAEAARVLAAGGELQVAELHPARQERGARARYRDPATGATRHVDAWVHPAADHLAAARRAGLELAKRDDLAADGDDLPRLLRLRFVRRNDAARSGIEVSTDPRD